MSFNSPIWLVALAPWTALVAWMLWGRLEKRRIPFLNLWPRESPQWPRPKRAWEKPPLALTALLAAMLLGIIAAAGPMNSSSIQTQRPQTTNVGIDMLAVQAQPTTQAMIRLSNQSDLSTASLTIRANGKSVWSQNVKLPAKGEKQNYFVDIPGSPSIVEAELQCEDQIKSDHLAKVERRAAWPIVEAASPLPPELQRMIGVYEHRRPPGEGSTRVSVTTIAQAPIANGPAAIVMDESSNGRKIPATEPLTVLDVPITRSLDWQKVLAGATLSAPPPGNWQAVVSIGGAPVVALRTDPTPLVWVGFLSDDFAHRADFVVFWSNVFDWLGDGAPSYDSISPNPKNYPASPPIAVQPARPVRSLTGVILLGAMGLLILSAATWPRPAPANAKTFQS